MMNTNNKNEVSTRLLFILLLLLPLIVLFLLPGDGMMLGGIWFWFVLLLCFWIIWSLLGAPADEGEAVVEIEPRMLAESEQPAAVREAMNVRIATEEAGVQVFRGRLREAADVAYTKLKRSMPEQTVPLPHTLWSAAGFHCPYL